MGPINVLHTLDNAYSGGGDNRGVLYLAQALLGSQYRCLFALLHRKKPELDLSAFPMYRMGGVHGDDTLARRLRVAGTLVGIARRRNVRIVHSHVRAMDRLALASLKALGVRTVVTIHGVGLADCRRTGIGLKVLNRIVDRWTAVGPALAEHLKSNWGIPAAKIAVVTNGIPVDDFGPSDDRTREQTRQRLGLAPHDVFCFSAGRLSPEKDFPFMLRAFSRASRKDDRLRLFIAGEGRERPRLTAQIRSLNLEPRASLLGFRPDMRELLSAADVFLMTSTFEGLSKATTEAMAAAKPVIATNVVGLKDLVEDGRTGLLVGSGDVEGYAEAIASLGANSELRRTMGRRGRQRAKRHFSLESMVSGYKKLYAELLD